MDTFKLVAEEYARKIEAQSRDLREAAVLGFHAGFEHGFALAEPLFFDPDESPDEGARILAKPKESPLGVFVYTKMEQNQEVFFRYVPCSLYFQRPEDAYCFRPDEIDWWTAIPGK